MLLLSYYWVLIFRGRLTELIIWVIMSKFQLSVQSLCVAKCTEEQLGFRRKTNICRLEERPTLSIFCPLYEGQKAEILFLNVSFQDSRLDNICLWMQDRNKRGLIYSSILFLLSSTQDTSASRGRQLLITFVICRLCKATCCLVWEWNTPTLFSNIADRSYLTIWDT